MYDFVTEVGAWTEAHLDIVYACFFPVIVLTNVVRTAAQKMRGKSWV